MADAFAQLFMRTWQKTLRRPVLLTFSFVQPLWWMLLFGFLFQRAVSTELLAGLDYTSFVAPGISLLTVLFGASQAGISIIRDAQSGLLARMLSTPTPAWQLLLAKLSADVSRFVLLALCVLGLGVLCGAQLRVSLWALPLASLAVLAFALLCASLSCAVAALTREPELMGAYVHVINMPLLFTSTALMPARTLPTALSSLAALNPMSVAVEAWRALFLSTPSPHPGKVALLALAALVAFVFSQRALGRQRVGR